MNEPRPIYQLWCKYQPHDGDVWKLEGLFRSLEDANFHVRKLRDSLQTPCMSDWAIVRTEGWW